MYMFVDKTMEKMKPQKKLKEKRSDHKMAKEKLLQNVGNFDQVDTPIQSDVKRRTVDLLSYPLDQALGKMEKEGVKCLLFKNTVSGQPNVLYLSREKEIPLLEPPL